jgi:hypothetical protein
MICNNEATNETNAGDSCSARMGERKAKEDAKGQQKDLLGHECRYWEQNRGLHNIWLLSIYGLFGDI